MNKQQKIREAYGEYWKDYCKFIDEDGFIFQSDLFFPDTEMKKEGIEIQIKSVDYKHKWSNIKWRPRSLVGLENNNGWIKIESEEDLPKDQILGEYFVMMKKDSSIHVSFFNSQTHKYQWLENVSHYQPIEKPKPPLY